MNYKISKNTKLSIQNQALDNYIYYCTLTEQDTALDTEGQLTSNIHSA